MSVRQKEIIHFEEAVARRARVLQLPTPARRQPGLKWLRRVLIGLELFTGIAAVGGGILLIAGPSTMLPPLSDSPLIGV